MTTAADIGRGLGGAKKGGEWLCRCPAHEDHDPSLAIIEKSGKVLLTCRAGCSNDAVIEQLRHRGLWSEPSAERSRIIATYSYRDQDGALRYQVARLHPKTFRQRRPNGSPDSWFWNMNGVEPLPYRLGEIVSDPDATVFVCEGEKDCDRLGELGLVATTNHGGAGKWRPEISHWLAGRNVVVLPDNDDPGRAHACDVAQKIRGIAASVRVVDLPDLPIKGDVSDWLDAGGTVDELERLARAQDSQGDVRGDLARLPIIEIHDAGDIDPTQIKPRQWLLGITFCRKFISGVIAEGGGGKTATRYAQYLAAATGRNLTGEHVHVRSRTLIVCLEDDLDEVRRRIGAAMLYHGVTREEIMGWLFYCTPKGLKLLATNTPGGGVVVGDLYSELRKLIPELKIDIVGIDPFIKSHGVDENDNNAIDQVCIMLAQLADECNCAIDIPHHARKGAAQPGEADRSRGASALVDAARLMRTITGMTADEAKLFGVSNADRTALIRVDDAKVNLTPRSADAMWFKLVGVSLGNTEVDPIYQHGDVVQTVERWFPPDLMAGITIAIAAIILDAIDAGLPNGDRYSDHNAATKRAAWKVVKEHVPDKTDEQAREIVRTWVKNKVLFLEDYSDTNSDPAKGLRLDQTKRPK